MNLNDLISGEEIIQILHQNIPFYFDYDNLYKRVLNNLPSVKMTSDEMFEYARQFENDTDNFIYKIISNLSLEQSEYAKIVANTDDSILIAFHFRTGLLTEMFKKNLEAKYPVLSSTKKQLLANILINDWHETDKYVPLFIV